MKRKTLSLLLIVIMLLCSTALFGCGSAEVTLVYSSENLVVIKVNSTEGFASALSALTYLKDKGEITFESVSSTYGEYVTSINGKTEVANGNSGASWMLYTSDSENSSTEFGTVSYDGMTWGQAAFGASTLEVKVGEYYAWSYDSWSF